MNAVEFLNWLDEYRQSVSQNKVLKPLVMGVLNVTSDSFFDGGQFLSVNRACEHAFTMIAKGVDIIDVGGESTKPGAHEVAVDTELDRVIPVIQEIRKHSDVCISIDTYKPEVMSAAIAMGANIINDINALRAPGALSMAARLAVPVCIMHMQGTPQTMQNKPEYNHGVVQEICDFFSERLVACAEAGIDKERLILDPGFGFGKLVHHNLQLVHHLEQFREFHCPLLLGVSRKSTIGAILGVNPEERLIGSIALSVYAAIHGVGIIRTHDVEETNQALVMIDAINRVHDAK